MACLLETAIEIEGILALTVQRMSFRDNTLVAVEKTCMRRCLGGQATIGRHLETNVCQQWGGEGVKRILGTSV